MYSSDNEISSDVHVGRVFTTSDDDYHDNDDSYSENDDDDNDDYEDNTTNDEDDGLLRYLFDKDSMKQHAFAICVALVAAFVSYNHLLPEEFRSTPTSGNDAGTSTSTAIPIPSSGSQKGKRNVPLKLTDVHHHHDFQRTNNIFFCPMGLISPSDSHQVRIRRALSMSDAGNAQMDMEMDMDIDPNLQLFQFNFPKKYTDLLNEYFIADDKMDDFYNSTFTSDSDMTDNVNFQCLIDATIENQHKSSVPMNSIAYIHSDINAYYRNENDDDNSIASNLISIQQIMREKHGEGRKEPRESVSLAYTGFTAKFINLSTKPMLLFWDGKNKPKLRARIEPFESFSTVTFPGNSFYTSPIYDKEHAMERWVMTADESVVAYDALTNDEELLNKLSREQRLMYDMQKLNMAYAREYLAVTHRSWLSMFPRPQSMHYMWDGTYFGQEHIVKTDQTHFISMPGNNDAWKMLDYADYDHMADESKRNGERSKLNLSQYRAKDPLELTMKAVSVAPRVFEIDNFLSDIEVDHLIEIATIYNVTTDSIDVPAGKKKKKRSNFESEAFIRREMSPIMDAIYHRSANILNIDESLLRHRNEHENSELNTHHSIAEAMHITQFVTGQGYVPRSDFSPASLKNRYQPNRFATIMFFLNDVEEEEDGDTVFPLAVNANNHDGVRIVPKKGKAVLFYNMLPDGNVDDLSHHSNQFLRSGEKWMGTLYVWDPIID